MPDKPSCKIPECSKPSTARGLCKSHYNQEWRKRRQQENAPCGVPGCPDPSLSKGYCVMHYTRVQKHGDPGPAERLRAPKGRKPLCKADGCDKPHNAHGYCSHHVRQYVYALRTERCTVEGCDRPLSAKGYCSTHYYSAWGGHGGAEYTLDKRCRCVLCEQYRTEHPVEWARAQHVWHERLRRRRRALEQFGPERKAAVTRRLRAGRADSATIGAAAAAGGITVTRLWVYVDLVPEWGRKVNAVLMETRDSGLKHGTEWAYKHGRCRCPECRESNRLRSQRERATNAGSALKKGRSPSYVYASDVGEAGRPVRRSS